MENNLFLSIKSNILLLVLSVALFYVGGWSFVANYTKTTSINVFGHKTVYEDLDYKYKSIVIHGDAVLVRFNGAFYGFLNKHTFFNSEFIQIMLLFTAIAFFFGFINGIFSASEDE